MRQFERLRAAYDADTLEPTTDFRPVADHVVVRAIWHGVGQGPDLSMEMTTVYTMRSGMIFEVEFIRDHAEALEAVGLSE
jgi:hypothetical protein